MSKEDLKEIIDRYYKLRNFEISNLWQRSIFLTAFLLLCFTGYGNVVINTLSDSKPYYHVVAVFISLIGYIFSILWIMMGKGSKAWFEFYEQKIIAAENYAGIDEKYIMGEHCFDKKEFLVDTCIFTRKAGAFSPSKINILIGQICMVIWIFLFLVHLYLYINEKCKIFNSNNICIFIFLFISVLLIIFMPKILKKYSESEFLSKFSSQAVKKTDKRNDTA